LRFLPDIRYGAENYPEKVARRLRALNLAAWTAAAVAAFGFANYVVLEFLNPKPELWKAGVVYALAASIWASVPLLHRFGSLWGALTLTLNAHVYFFSLTLLFGTGAGVQLCYLVAGALIVVFLGAERTLPSAVAGILAVLLFIALQIMVPYDTGLLDSAALLTSFVISVTVTMAILIAIVTFALREAARAEANLAREHAVVQDKSRQLEMANRQLEMADRYKSHFLASASHDRRGGGVDERAV
jgi:adenylate cyclase